MERVCCKQERAKCRPSGRDLVEQMVDGMLMITREGGKERVDFGQVRCKGSLPNKDLVERLIDGT